MRPDSDAGGQEGQEGREDLQRLPQASPSRSENYCFTNNKH